MHYCKLMFCNHLFFFPIERERSLVSNLGSNMPLQPLMDIFLEYKITERPTAENITRLVKKAAKMSLVKGPSFG